MIEGVGGDSGVGQVTMHISGPGGHPLEFWARRMAEKLAAMADGNSEKIVAKEDVYNVALFYLTEARRSDRAAQSNPTKSTVVRL